MGNTNVITFNDYKKDIQEPATNVLDNTDLITDDDDRWYAADVLEYAWGLYNELEKTNYDYLVYYFGVGKPLSSNWALEDIEKRKADVINMENHLFQEVLEGNDEIIKPLSTLIVILKLINSVDDNREEYEAEYNKVDSPAAYFDELYFKFIQRSMALVKEAKSKRSRKNKTTNTSQDAAIKELKKQLSEMNLLLNKLTANIG